MKQVLGIAAVAASVAFASPAYAAITLGTQSLNQGQTVQFQTQQTGSSITAFTNQTNTPVTFSGQQLQSNAAGQAVVTGTSGILTGTLVVQVGSTFSYAEFNLPGIEGPPPPPEATSVLVQAFLGNNLVEQQVVQPLGGNGNNFITITGATYDRIQLTLSPQGAGVGDFRQLRINTAAAVPEPGTWAMMLIGFGAMGVSIRRSRRKHAYLLQAA